MPFAVRHHIAASASVSEADLLYFSFQRSHKTLPFQELIAELWRPYLFAWRS